MAQLETRTEPMVVNFGPHHPSMHGVLRLVVTLDGENYYKRHRKFNSDNYRYDYIIALKP